MNRICILATGSREWIDARVVRERLHALLPVKNLTLAYFDGRQSVLPHHSVLLAGDANGLDRIAQRIAKELGYLVEPTPYFSELGKKGGPLRNQLLVDKLLCYGRHGYVMHVEAFILPSCVGTLDCLKRVTRAQTKLSAAGDPAKIIVYETRRERP